jgi:hypothetical protein
VNGKNPPGLYQYYGELNYHQKITNLAKSSLVNSIKSVKMTDFFSVPDILLRFERKRGKHITHGW